MLEDYLPLFPGIDRAQTAYVNEVLDGLRDAAEFVFPHAAMNRAQIESLVAQYNHEKLDGILILLLTYSQGAYLVRALEENHLPLGPCPHPAGADRPAGLYRVGLYGQSGHPWKSGSGETS